MRQDAMILLMLRLIADDHRRRYRKTRLSTAALAIEPLLPDFMFDLVALQQQADSSKMASVDSLLAMFGGGG